MCGARVNQHVEGGITETNVVVHGVEWEDADDHMKGDISRRNKRFQTVLWQRVYGSSKFKHDPWWRCSSMSDGVKWWTVRPTT